MKLINMSLQNVERVVVGPLVNLASGTTYQSLYLVEGGPAENKNVVEITLFPTGGAPIQAEHSQARNVVDVLYPPAPPGPPTCAAV